MTNPNIVNSSVMSLTTQEKFEIYGPTNISKYICKSQFKKYNTCDNF